VGVTFVVLALMPTSKADTMGNVTVSLVGTRDPQGQVYFRISQTLAQPCYGGMISIDTTAGTGKYSFAAILTAYLTGRNAQWLDYTYSATTTRCTLNQFDM
jgi:hypothetical protein